MTQFFDYLYNQRSQMQLNVLNIWNVQHPNTAVVKKKNVTQYEWSMLNR